MGGHLSSSAVSEATVLLLATAQSSYLWFDQEHGSRNIKLCTFLKSHSVNVKFVVCPTTKSARDAWEQHTPNLLSVFGEFLPETGIVDVWPDFDPDHPVEAQQIRSLIHQVRRVQSPGENLDPETQSSGWPWKLLAILLVSVVIALLPKLSSMQSEIAGLQKSLEEVKQLHVAGAHSWDGKFAKMEQKDKELEDELARQQKVVEGRLAKIEQRNKELEDELARQQKVVEGRLAKIEQRNKELEDELARQQKVVEEAKETCAAGKKQHFQALSDPTNHSQRMMTWHTCGKSCDDRAADSLLHFEPTDANDDFNGGYVKKQGETCHQFQRNISHHGNRPSDPQLGGIRSTLASLIYIGIVGVSNVLQTCVLQTVVL